LGCVWASAPGAGFDTADPMDAVERPRLPRGDSAGAVIGRRSLLLAASWREHIDLGPVTAPAVTKRMMAALRRAGKLPVKYATAPGIIVPRIQAYRDETLTRSSACCSI
jgi:hypothetical protein